MSFFLLLFIFFFLLSMDGGAKIYKNEVQGEIKGAINSRIACYFAVQKLDPAQVM
jgi:hypothetical protein